MALESNCEQKSQNCQIGIKPPYVGQYHPKSIQMDMNLWSGMDDVFWVNYYTLDIMGVEIGWFRL